MRFFRFSILLRFIYTSRAATVIEYGLIMAAVAVALLTVVMLTGNSLLDLIDGLVGALDGPT